MNVIITNLLLFVVGVTMTTLTAVYKPMAVNLIPAVLATAILLTLVDSVKTAVTEYLGYRTFGQYVMDQTQSEPDNTDLKEAIKEIFFGIALVIGLVIL